MADENKPDGIAVPATSGNPFADLIPEGGIARPATAVEALARGIDRVQGTAYGAAEAIGEAAGFKGLRSFGKEGRERNVLEAAESAPPAQEFTGINSPSTAIQWAKETFAEQAPNIGANIAGGATGAYLGTFGGPLAPVTVPVGAVIGAFLPSFVSGIGEVQGNIKERDPNAVAPGYAIAGGVAIGALDSILPGKIGSSLVRQFGKETAEQIATKALSKQLPQSLSKEAGKSALLEGVTEAIQEAIGDAAAASGTGQGLDANLGKQMVEAFAAGALMGGTTSAGARVVEGVRDAGTPPSPTTPPPVPKSAEPPVRIDPVLQTGDAETPEAAPRKEPAPIKLYRGEPDPSTFDPRYADPRRVGRWYTTDLEDARGFAGPGGQVFELDVPPDAKIAKGRGKAADARHFTVPKALQKRRKLIEAVPAAEAETAVETPASETIPVDDGNPFDDLVPKSDSRAVPPRMRALNAMRMELQEAEPGSPLAASLDLALSNTGLPQAEAVRAAAWARENGRTDIADQILLKAEESALAAAADAREYPQLKEFADGYKNTFDTVKMVIEGRAGADAPPTARVKMPQDVLGFIRSLGGIQDQTGDLRAMDAHKRGGLINNKNGLPPDTVRARMVEEGFLHDAPYEQETTSSVNDLYELVDRALRGEKIYRESDRQAAEESRGQLFSSIQDEEDSYQIVMAIRKIYDDNEMAYPFTATEEGELVTLVKSGMSIDEAIEREAIDWNNEVETNEAIRSRASGNRPSAESGREAGNRSGTERTARGESADLRVAGEAREDELLAAVGGDSRPKRQRGATTDDLLASFDRESQRLAGMNLSAAIGGEDGTGSAFEDASEESWNDASARGTAIEWANERADSRAVRQDTSTRSQLEREATSVMEGIRKLEKGLRAKKASPAEIAAAIEQSYGLKVKPEEIARGNVWWRIDDILADETGRGLRRTPERVMRVAELYQGSDQTENQIAGTLSQEWKVPVNEYWVKNTIALHGIRRMETRRNASVDQRWTPARVELFNTLLGRGVLLTEIARQVGELPGPRVTPRMVQEYQQMVAPKTDVAATDKRRTRGGTLNDTDVARLSSGEFEGKTAHEIAMILSQPDPARGIPARSVTRMVIVGHWKRARDAQKREQIRSQLKKPSDEPMFAAGWFKPESWLEGWRARRDGRDSTDVSQSTETGGSDRGQGRGVASGQPGSGRADPAGSGVGAAGRRDGSARVFSLRGYVGRSIDAIPTAAGLGQRYVFLHPEKAKVLEGEGRGPKATVARLRAVPNWVARAHVVEISPGVWTVDDIKVRSAKRMRGLGNELLTEIEQQLGTDLTAPRVMTPDLFRVWQKRDPDAVADYARFRGELHSRDRLQSLRAANAAIANAAESDTRSRNAARKDMAEIDAVLAEMAKTDEVDAAFGTPSQDETVRRGIYSMLRMGRTYTAPQEVIDGVHEALEPHMGMVPANVNVATLARIEPVKGEPGVPTGRFVFHMADGTEGYLTGSVEKLLRYRAGFIPGRDGRAPSIVFFRVTLPDEFGDSLRSELAHEVTHALRRQGVIEGSTWDRVLAHAKSLRVLDYDQRGFLQAIGNPTYKTVPLNRKLREVYGMDYAGRSDYFEAMDQEEVTHLVELYIHNQLPKMDVDPVRDILDDIISGRKYGRAQEAASSRRAQPSRSRGQSAQMEMDLALEGDLPVTPGLDMSPEARKQRAEEQGFDTSRVLYHGTPSRSSEHNNKYVRAEGNDNYWPMFTAFDPDRGAQSDSGWLGRGIYVTKDPDYAEEFGDRILPLYVRVKNPFTIVDDGSTSWDNIYGFRKQLHDLGVDLPDSLKLNFQEPTTTTVKGWDGKTYTTNYAVRPSKNVKGEEGWSLVSSSGDPMKSGVVEAFAPTREQVVAKYNDKKDGRDFNGFMLHAVKEIGARELTQNLRERGYDAVREVSPAGIESEMVVFDPHNLRSVNAAFDPANVDSTDLLAAADRAMGKSMRRDLDALGFYSKIDKASPAPQKVATLDTPSKGAAGNGFTLFELTDVVKASVLDEGQPMFAFAGDRAKTADLDYDVPEDQQIVRFGGNGPQMSMGDGSAGGKLTPPAGMIPRDLGALDSALLDIENNKSTRVHGALSSYYIPTSAERAKAAAEMAKENGYTIRAEWLDRIANAPTLERLPDHNGYAIHRINNPRKGESDYILSDPSGIRIASATMNGNEIGYVSTNPKFQRQGFASMLYDAIEANAGIKLVPSGELIHPGSQALWLARDPDAVSLVYGPSTEIGKRAREIIRKRQSGSQHDFDKLAKPSKTDAPRRASGGRVTPTEEPPSRTLLSGIFDKEGAISRALRMIRRTN